MEIKLDENCLDILKKVADRVDVDSDKLYILYQKIMRSNFEQDLWDIANENEDYFKEEYEN